MDLSAAREMFDRGVFSSCNVALDMTLGGWVVLFRDGSGRTDALQTSRGDTRIFKDVGTAIRVSSEVGFDTIQVKTH